MDFKIKREVAQLVKIGIPEDIALIAICKKYGKEELVGDILEEQKEEQQVLNEMLKEFKQFNEN